MPKDDPTDTAQFVAANPHVLEEAERVWQAILQEIVNELLRCNIAFGRALAEARDPEDLLSQVEEAALSDISNAHRIIRASKGVGTDVQTDFGVIDTKEAARRITELYTHVRAQVVYVVTHPSMFNQYTLCTMVGVLFGRILDRHGVYPIGTASIIRLTNAVLEIMPPPEVQPAP